MVAAALAVVGSTAGSTMATADVNWALFPPTPPAVLLANGQTRLYDSRPGGRTVDGTGSGGGALSPGVIRKVTVTGRAGVLTTGAVVLNIEALNPRGAGFLNAWPCNQARPTTSLLNTAAGGPSVANTLIVELGTSKLCILSTAATDLVVDLQEQFAAAANFVPAAGTLRVVDTRNGTGGLTRLVPGVVTPLPDLGADFVNVTAVNPAGAGHLSILSCDAHFDFLSTINFGATTTANLANPHPGSGCVMSTVATDLIIDRVGDRPASGGEVSHGGATWTRLADTRRTPPDPTPPLTRLKAGVPTRVALYGQQFEGFPARAGALILDLITVRSAGNGELKTFKCAGTPRTTAMYPMASAAVSHLAFVDLASDRTFCVISTVDTDLVIDGGTWFTTPGRALTVESQTGCAFHVAPATVTLDGDGGTGFGLDVSGGIAPYTLDVSMPADWHLITPPNVQLERTRPFSFDHPVLPNGSITVTIRVRDRIGASATLTFVIATDGRRPLPTSC